MPQLQCSPGASPKITLVQSGRAESLFGWICRLSSSDDVFFASAWRALRLDCGVNTSSFVAQRSAISRIRQQGLSCPVWFGRRAGPTEVDRSLVQTVEAISDQDSPESQGPFPLLKPGRFLRTRYPWCANLLQWFRVLPIRSAPRYHSS